jgi:hypothetical protein
MNPLELATLEELMTELLNRCDHGCIALLIEQDAEEALVYRKWSGNAHTIMGLAQDASSRVLENYRSRARKVEPYEKGAEDGDG